jgi:glycosyltransferase involved in cell wall biosynthesis
MTPPTVTIAICTHNRATLLADCLDALSGQVAELVSFEVLVVDNASTDDTAGVAARFQPRIAGFRYVHEAKLGLAYARNRAIAEAKAPWLAFLDDDATILDGYATRLAVLTGEGSYDCVGGVYLPWYRDGRRPWYQDRYASNVGERETLGELPANSFATGNNCLFRLSALRDIGGFDTALGMSGQTIAYGEETRVQVLMRQKGYRIGFDPQWRVCHYVPLAKQRMDWILRSAFAQGRDSWRTFDEPVRLPALLTLLRKLLTRPLSGLLGWLRDGSEKRSWQNLVIAAAEPAVLTIGQLVAGIRSWRHGSA